MRMHGAGCGCGVGRRGVLAGLAGGFTAAAVGGWAVAQPAVARRIDVHHHLSPPDYLTRMAAVGVTVNPPSRNWTLAKTVEDMDRAGVRTAMLSISTPGLWLGDGPRTADLARACNEYAAGLVRDQPRRFGSFAALPLPDVDASLRAIEYAYDTLHADGIGAFTSYDGKYLGDPAFAPVLQELNRRRAVLFTHPATTACCTNLVPGIPDNAIEFGTDTTRTLASLVFGGATVKYPDLTIVFSHAGGTMPMLIERFEFLARTHPGARALPGGGGPAAVRRALASYHYDTAQVANPAAMGALRQLVPVSNILFGSDYPYRDSDEQVGTLAGCGFSATDLAAIEHGNVERMLPRARPA